MKLISSRNLSFFSTLWMRSSWKAYLILIIGIALTIGATIQTKNTATKVAHLDFAFICNDVKQRIETRLRAHAQLLRSASAFFAASDTVTRNEWRKFNECERIYRNLPGIQGVGYSVIIAKKQLNQHIQVIRNGGFPEYTVFPIGERAVYTSIIYLEPFAGRNLRAFGYDMFSNPTRRKAMEMSRDSDLAILSDKVVLVQETNEDIQAGTLMYVPVYKNESHIQTLEERRMAIKGWVYSPYRMNDLMSGILGSWDTPNNNPIHLEIFDDDTISVESLLFDSQAKQKSILPLEQNLNLKLPIDFNGKKWTLFFTSNNKDLSIFHGETLIVLFSGFIISLLLFVLSIALLKTRYHSIQIIRLNSELEKLNLDKNRFISILAHDLRSPFTALIGYADLLSKNIHTYSIDQIEEQIKIIDESAKQTFNLLDDTLAWARAQQGKLPYLPRKFNFSSLCTQVIDRLSLLAKNKNISLNHPPSKDLYVYADKNMLTTILHNLISNAIKFTGIGGRVDIVTEQNHNGVVVMVIDNGVGMDKETVEKLFDLSQPFTTKGTANETGTGLGLLLCKEFVEKHGGRIWVRSIEGEGSTFFFTLSRSET